MPIRLDLSLVTAATRVDSAALQQHRSVLSVAHAWALIRRLCVAHASQSPSLSLRRDPRSAKHYIWSRFDCRSCRRESRVGVPNALGASLRIFLRFTPLAFYMSARQRGFVIGVSPLLDGLSSQTDEYHLPEAIGFEAPILRLRPFLC